MTDVLVNLTRHTQTGRVPAAGVLRWTPTRRVHIDAPTDGPTDEIVVPASFEVPIDGPTVVTVDPSGTSWAWTVHEATQGGRTIRTVAVPDSPMQIDYGDLVDVDPATLAPAAEPTAAWWAAHDALVTQLGGLTDDVAVAVADYLTANPVDAPVTSVNGEIGAVVLDAADVGADPAGTAQGLVGALVIPDSPDDIGAAAVAHTHAPGDVTGTAVITTDPRLSDARTPTAHTHTLAAITDAGDAAGLNVGTTAGTVAAGDHTHAELHTHANTVALAAVSGTNTGDEPAASTTVAGIVELATTTEATTGTDTTRAVTPAGVAAAIAGVGGGVTDHGALSGLADDDHSAVYARFTIGASGPAVPRAGDFWMVTP